MDGGKFKRRLSEVNATALSRGQNELVVKFKMAAGDVISIRGQVMEYTYIPTGIKRELVGSGVDGDWKGVSYQDCWSLAHIQEITLDAGEEVDEVAGGVDVDRLGKVGDQPS